VLSGFDRWDISLDCTRGRLSATVMVQNIFDVPYAQSTVNLVRIIRGARRSTCRRMSVQAVEGESERARSILDLRRSVYS